VHRPVSLMTSCPEMYRRRPVTDHGVRKINSSSLC